VRRADTGADALRGPCLVPPLAAPRRRAP
jgi:hypothetical protein